MIRFETSIGVISGGKIEDRLLLQFCSTVVSDDFHEGEKFSGKDMKAKIMSALAKYKKRLEEKRGKDFADSEQNHFIEILGDGCANISEEKTYVIISSEEHLGYCELPFADRWYR